ncbi:MAG TPA: hypothetical protein P5572_10575 [Phycisphaerae bacterium]|nr:hypothetical protein [Phycisphaerae bacterium]
MPGLSDCTLLGVDGGATEVKAHHVSCDNLSAPHAFALAEAAAARVYPRRNGFAPLPVTQQLAEREAPQLTADEVAVGATWVSAAAEAIADTARQVGARRLIVGMGMPGLKTPTGRGIAVINNGPRIPDFLERLEQLLVEQDFELAAPIARLGSDADYCGVGEQWAEAGLFRDVENAYYVGGGTGVADALKLRGELVTFDAAREWMRKAWQIPSNQGPTFEQLVSARGMNAGYQQRIGATAPDRFPEVDALAGDPQAIAWLRDVADALAELIVERLDTVRNGRRALTHRGDDYAKLTSDHPYRGTLLDRVVIGQRIGMLYADARCRPFFADHVDAAFARRVHALEDPQLARHVLAGDAPRPGFLQASQLRAAPALGAAVSAVQAL